MALCSNNSLLPLLFYSNDLVLPAKIEGLTVMELTSLSAISAIDGRYRKQVQHLDEYFSEYALMKYRVMVEIEYLLFLSEKKFCSLTTKSIKQLNKLKDDFNDEDARQIKQIEVHTNHDVKAVEYF